MIERIWIKNFRMLASNRIDLQPFAVLVGRNASGKSTFMSVFRFVSRFFNEGFEAAVEEALGEAGTSFQDLCFDEQTPISFALQISLHDRHYRYELSFGFQNNADSIANRPSVICERLYETPTHDRELQQASLFELSLAQDDTILTTSTPPGWRLLAEKVNGTDHYFPEEPSATAFAFGAGKSVVASAPSSAETVGMLAVRDLLRDGITAIELNPHLRETDTTLRRRYSHNSDFLEHDGRNMAHVAEELQRRDAVAFAQWVAHVASAVSGLVDIDIWIRPEDKKRVLRATFTGLHSEPVPSWLLSDGTLRLMVLTLLAYSETKQKPQILLIEEPENGLHPLAIQSVFEALSSMTSSQVFVATHSPVFLASVELERALVFQRTSNGTARILRGKEVAELSNWRSTVQLTDVFATGVLS
jgi:predicted ATPase